MFIFIPSSHFCAKQKKKTEEIATILTLILIVSFILKIRTGKKAASSYNGNKRHSMQEWNSYCELKKDPKYFIHM